MELHEILSSLNNYNAIKFSAYRTGMKLFALQKRLCLDLVDLADLDREFRLLPVGITQIPWESLFTVLRHLFETAHLSYPQCIQNVASAIRKCAELLRQLAPHYSTRTVMLILIVLCNGKLDDKYRYLFLIYANGSDSSATKADLQAMFGDLAKVSVFLRSLLSLSAFSSQFFSAKAALLAVRTSKQPFALVSTQYPPIQLTLKH
jgi:hypothetical protein